MKTFLLPAILLLLSACSTDGGPPTGPPEAGTDGRGSGGGGGGPGTGGGSGGGPGTGGTGLGSGGSTGTACLVKAGIYTVTYTCGSHQYQATWPVAKDLACPTDTSGIPTPSGDLSALAQGETFCTAIGSFGTGLIWTPDGAAGSTSLELNCSSSRGTTIATALCNITIIH